MVSEEVVLKAVETLKGFSPEVLAEAIKEIPGMNVMKDNNQNHYNERKLEGTEARLRAHQ